MSKRRPMTCVSRCVVIACFFLVQWLQFESFWVGSSDYAIGWLFGLHLATLMCNMGMDAMFFDNIHPQ